MPATLFFERAGPIADPMYHGGDVGDRVSFDFDQLSITKARLVTLRVAGFRIKPEDRWLER